ncbi:MAG: hypothetical protein LUG12_13485, partial [Erysipelotrichaceae bacterium]|nr:hypothetical protein [Erysipelotrichaceae bacterium]
EEFLEDAQNKAFYVEKERIRIETYSYCTKMLAETLKKLLISKFHEISMELEQYIEYASFDDLNNAILYVQCIQKPEEILSYLFSNSCK